MIDWFFQTLKSYPEIAIFISLALCYYFGSFTYKGLGLGAVTATLIAAVIIGQIGITISGPLKPFFFLMFLFAIGYGVGPQFVRGIAQDGVPQAIGGPKPRLLLGCLLAHRRTVVSADRLCEELWGDDQPAAPRSVLQSHVSRLRRILEPDALIVARPPGYALDIEPARVDADEFERLVASAAAPGAQGPGPGLSGGCLRLDARDAGTAA